MEIGSVYEMNPNCIEKITEEQQASLCLAEVDKYRRKNISYTASARESISLALYSIEKECPEIKKKCLVPTYMCDTVFIPFVKNGWELVFYHIDKDMKADRTELEELIDSENPSIFFVHDYYGTDTWAGLRTFLDGCQDNGMLIMEDVTQAYYLNVNTQADYIIGSLRKWYAIPDGGFVASNHSISEDVVVKDDTFAMERFRMLSKKWEYLTKTHDKKQKEEYLAHNRELEERLDDYEKITSISDLAKSLLAEADEDDSKKRRNDNYRILQDGLRDRICLSPVMENYGCETPGMVSPLYFPVYMKDREKLQSYLRERDIYVPVLWPIAKENEELLTKTEEYIFSHIAAIPMDQRYGKEDMERIVAVIEEYEETYG